MTKILTQLEDYFRMWAWPFVAACLLVFLDRPEQVAVLIYKAIMISVAVWLGYWADRNLFGDDGRIVPGTTGAWVGSAYLRRAIIVGAVVIGFSLGL